MEELKENEELELNDIIDKMIMNNSSFSLFHDEMIIDKDKSSYLLRIIDYHIELDINIIINHDYQIIKYDYHELRIKENYSNVNKINNFMRFINDNLNFKDQLSITDITVID